MAAPKPRDHKLADRHPFLCVIPLSIIVSLLISPCPSSSTGLWSCFFPPTRRRTAPWASFSGFTADSGLVTRSVTAADLIGLIPSVLMCAAVLWYLGRERSKETALRIWTKKWSGAEADPRP